MNRLRWVGVWAAALVWLAIGVGCSGTADSDARVGKEKRTVEPEDKVESVLADIRQRSQIAFRSVQQLRGIEHAELRLGGKNRIFLIEDQWDYDRYVRLIPELPLVNFKTESLLVVASWGTQPRFLHYLRSAGKTLIVGIAQRSPPRVVTGDYSPPQFLVTRLPVWGGEVRFEINGQHHFSIWRGKELEKHTDRVWKEFLHVYSGNKPSIELQVRYWSQRWPRASRDEVRAILDGGEKKYEIRNQALFPILLNDLTDLCARPAVSRIFDLIESMGKHDKAFTPAWQTLVGIGGQDVVYGCRKALKSQNPESRHAAILILKNLGLPETRDLAHAHLTGPDIRLARGALGLLRRIGLQRQDVSEITQAILELESKMCDPNQSKPLQNFNGAGSADIGSLIYALDSLGPLASEAIPMLEQLAEEPRFPLSKNLQKYARKALKEIRTSPSEMQRANKGK